MRRSVICMCLIALLPAVQVADAASLQCGEVDTNGEFISYGLPDGSALADCPSDQMVWRNDESPVPSLTLEQGAAVGGASFCFIGLCWLFGTLFTAMGKTTSIR